MTDVIGGQLTVEHLLLILFRRIVGRWFLLGCVGWSYDASDQKREIIAHVK